jgi:hypothetical protein
MKSTVSNTLVAVFISFGLALAAMGVYVADADDAPGGAVMGLLLLIGAVVLARKAARHRLAPWAAATALAVGIVIAAFSAFLTHAVAVTAPLFAQPPDVPSVMNSAPSPQYAAAVDRARPVVRAAIVEQNLPGVSIAVGMNGDIVWAEGFGWRDVITRAPVTPDTRFNIGTAATVVATGAIASLGLANTGTDSAAEWSPAHIGEPEEDFPLFTLVHDIILRPIGVAAPARPLPGNRATFYVPRSADSNPRRGRRLMYMRDLACCVEGMAFYSTAPDLVRFALSAPPHSVNGELAGGMVMSLITRPDSGIVVAVLSNITHANSSALALRIEDAFATHVR